VRDVVSKGRWSSKGCNVYNEYGTLVATCHFHYLPLIEHLPEMLEAVAVASQFIPDPVIRDRLLFAMRRVQGIEG
jgi:hypothetical protein